MNIIVKVLDGGDHFGRTHHRFHLIGESVTPEIAKKIENMLEKMHPRKLYSYTTRTLDQINGSIRLGEPAYTWYCARYVFDGENLNITKDAWDYAW